MVAPLAPLLERGILLNRVNAHTDPPRYVEFGRGDWDAFSAAHSDPEPWHRRLVNQSGGIVINRWNVVGDRLPSYIRFDTKIQPDTRRDRRTKYIYPGRSVIERYGPSPAKRWDVHPWVRPILEDSSTVILAIEGCLKADALWSRGYAALSIPSVTMWQAPLEHMEMLVPLLRRKRLYLCADSDYNVKGYRRNGAPVFQPREVGEPGVNRTFVRVHADKAVRYLQTFGLDPSFMIPPWISAAAAARRGLTAKEGAKVGIDDHLAWGGNLERWDKGRNPRGVHIFRHPRFVEPLPRRRRDRAYDRDSAFYDWLVRTHGREGLYQPSDACHELKMSSKQIQRAKDSLVDRGVIQVWHGLYGGEEVGNLPHLFRFEVRRERR
jgi:hypothetical protein